MRVLHTSKSPLHDLGWTL